MPIAGKSLALLIWLVRGASGPAHREQLADLLWSDAEEERALQSLRQALSQLRAHLGTSAIHAEGRTVKLVDAIACDADVFEAAVAAADHERASATYAGAFLDRFALPGASQFEHWADRERQRLRALWIGVQDSRTQRLLDAGRAREAHAIASSLRDADPERERSWRLMIESALALGNAPLAQGDATAFSQALVDAGRDAEPASRRLLQRVLRGVADAPAAVAERTVIEGDLVGRESQFARLIAGWQGVEQSGRSVHLTLEAPAGLGKSRLLRDVAHRLAAAGASCLMTRAHIGEREIPFAFASSVAAAIGGRPGAAGVAPDAAASLCALAPELRAVYRAAVVENTRAEDLLRTRAWALAELVRAVTEDMPLALMLDDWQWADNGSRVLLDSALASAERASLLVVRARRSHETPGVVGLDDADGVITLGAWTEAETRAFVESIAEWPTAMDRDQLLAKIHEVAAGSPLQTRAVLELAMEGDLLALNDGVWHIPHADALATWLSSVHLVEAQVQRLDTAARRVALSLAVAGRDLPRVVLAAATGIEGPEAVLDALERRGWIEMQGETVRLAHDSLQATMIESATEAELRTARRSVGRALAARSDLLDRVGAQRAARLLVDADDSDGLRSLFFVWRGRPTVGRKPASAWSAAHELLGDDATPVRVALLVRAVPWAARLADSPWPLAMAGAVAMALGAGGWAMASASARPFAVRFIDAPLNVTSRSAVPTPIVEIVDVSGRRVERDGDTVQIDMAGQTKPWHGSRAVTRAGVARFSEFRSPEGEDLNSPVYRASSGRLRPDSSALLVGSTLRIVGGTVNAAPLDSPNHSVRLVAGERLVAQLSLRVSTRWAAAAVMLAAVPTWGDARTSWIELGPVPTPTRDHLMSTSFSVTAPRRPGRYYVFVATDAEPSSVWIASGTNWLVGRPRWGDGNDLATFGEAEAAVLRANAGEPTPRMWRYFRHSPRERALPAADVITVDVIARPPAR